MKATIQTLTPVHIGNGTKYIRNIDFLQQDQLIAILDEKKIFDFIGQDNLHHWVNAINIGGNHLREMLYRFGYTEKSLQKIAKRICAFNEVKCQHNELKEQFSGPLTGPCIPGSSLKGAMRTFLFNYLTTYDTFINNFLTKDVLSFVDGKEKWSSINVEKKIFGNDPSENVLRFIKIEDVVFQSIETKVYEVNILNRINRGWELKEKSHYYVETIPPLETAEFKIKIDNLLLTENLKHQYVKNVITDYLYEFPTFFSIIKTTLSQILKEEIYELRNAGVPGIGQNLINYLNKILDLNKNLKSNECILRVGSNSGWTFTTGGWIFNFVQKDSPNYYSLQTAIQKGRPRNFELLPKTRKMTSSGMPFGFVKITLHESE